MYILLVPLAIMAVVAAIGGFVAAKWGERLGTSAQWRLFGALLACSLLPIAWHYQQTIGYAFSYGAYHPDEPVGFYPSLRRFQYGVPIGVALLWAVGWLAAQRLPLLGVALPAVGFATYLRALGWVEENPPGVVLDNKMNIALFMLEAAATLGLATFVLALWGRRGRVEAER